MILKFQVISGGFANVEHGLLGGPGNIPARKGKVTKGIDKGGDPRITVAKNKRRNFLTCKDGQEEVVDQASVVER